MDLIVLLEAAWPWSLKLSLISSDLLPSAINSLSITSMQEEFMSEFFCVINLYDFFEWGRKVQHFWGRWALLYLISVFQITVLTNFKTESLEQLAFLVDDMLFLSNTKLLLYFLPKEEKIYGILWWIDDNIPLIDSSILLSSWDNPLQLYSQFYW